MISWANLLQKDALIQGLMEEKEALVDDLRTDPGIFWPE
jgi:hypothetical protein